MTEQLRRKPGRKSKGDRRQLSVRFHAALRPIVDELADELGIPSGQFVADVVALDVGLPQLMLELRSGGDTSDEGLFDLISDHIPSQGRLLNSGHTTTEQTGSSSTDGKRKPLTVRLHVDVLARVERTASERSIPAAFLVNDLMATHVGRPDLSLGNTNQEVIEFDKSA